MHSFLKISSKTLFVFFILGVVLLLTSISLSFIFGDERTLMFFTGLTLISFSLLFYFPLQIIKNIQEEKNHEINKTTLKNIQRNCDETVLTNTLLINP